MTHAESQDLLLDLVYGELDAARAGELHAHLAGCEECRKEKAAIDGTRAAAAPVRESEEPSEAFDERVMRAARAQAQLEHDGNIGEVVEVSGSVKPLGIEPADIDAMAPVKARATGRKRPRWMMPAAVGGSLAAAAALALVVGTTLQANRPSQAADQARYEIKVQPAAPPPDTSLARAQPPQAESAAPRPPPAPEPAPLPPAPGASASRQRARTEEGSGGDAEPAKKAPLAKKQSAPPAQAGPERPLAAHDSAQAAAAGPSSGAPAQGQPASKATAPSRGEGVATDPRDRLGARAPSIPGPPVVASAKPSAEGRSAQATGAVRQESAIAQTQVEERPEAVEDRAREARHSGDYAEAAALYRRAAQLHRQRGAAASLAAWDLAHAVECLAASGQFEEARKVRDDLNAAYPAEETARTAAARVLRTVEPASRSAPQTPAELAPVQR